MFPYLELVHHPFKLLAFFSIVCSFISMWVHKRFWVWVSFCLISFVFAFFGKVITLEIFIFLAILFGLHLLIHKEIRGFARAILFTLITIISFGLLFHIVPGFNNWEIIKAMHIGKDGTPYSMYLNFDKPFVGLFVLGINTHLIDTKFHLKQMLKKSIPLITLGILLLLGLAYFLEVLRFDPKIPLIFPIWFITNLFLVTIPEEAFFRGFLQKEIRNAIPNKFSAPFSIFIVALMFAIIHFAFMPSYEYISITFLAGIIYGTIYEISKSVESAIICHFLVNLLHFLFFTYPMLQEKFLVTT